VKFNQNKIEQFANANLEEQSMKNEGAKNNTQKEEQTLARSQRKSAKMSARDEEDESPKELYL